MDEKKASKNWANRMSKEEKYEYFKKMAKISNSVPRQPTRWTEEAIYNLCVELLEWTENPTSIWFEKFALERSITPQHLAGIAARYPDFGAVYAYAKDWQKNKLIEGGLLNKLNPTITKLLLSQYGIYQKTQVEHDGAQPIHLVNYAEKNSRPKWKNDGEEDDERRDEDTRRSNAKFNLEDELEKAGHRYQEEDGGDS